MFSHLVFNLCISLMESCILLPLRCFSNREDVSISRKLFNLSSTHTYDDEGEVPWPEHLHNFLSMIYEEDEFTHEQVGLLLAFTVRESPFRWVINLLTDIVHSCEHFCDLIEDEFHHFDADHLDQKMLQKWRASHESVIDFWLRFHDLWFQAPKSQMKFAYLWDRFEYCLKKFSHPKRKLDVKPRSTFFTDGTMQSHVGSSTVSTDFPPPFHSTVPPSPSDVEDHVRTSFHYSHALTITPLNFPAELVVNPLSSHMHSFFRPPSSHSGVPPDDVVLGSSIPDSSLVVNKEQPTYGVGVAQPTCAVIQKEYEWELEHQHLAKDDSLLSEPPLFLPRCFGEPAIHDFVCVSSSTDAPIVDHSQDSPDASQSFDNGEDKLFIEDPLDPSSVFSRNTEDEFVHFSSTSLFDSSDHEDAEEFIDFSNRGGHD